jgi:hypothetical protein
VPVRIVDRLETVEVEDQNGRRAIVVAEQLRGERVEEAAVGESGELVVVGQPPERGTLLLQLLDVRRELIDAGLEAGSRRLGPQRSVIWLCAAGVGGGRFEDPHRPSSQDCGGPAGSCRVDGEASPSATRESWQPPEERARFHEDNCHGDIMHPWQVSATLGPCTFVVKESSLALNLGFRTSGRLWEGRQATGPVAG